MPIKRTTTYVEKVQKVPTHELTYECDWCGTTETDFDLWFPVRVSVGQRGEEGYAEGDRVACGDCAGAVCDALVEAGFGNHYHGDINFLEDNRCPGNGDVIGGECPTPMSYEEFWEIDG